LNAIVLKDVTKQFGELLAVRNLTFDVLKGSIFGLLGPNGAGKTTTIRMITNIIGVPSVRRRGLELRKCTGQPKAHLRIAVIGKR